MLFLIRYSDQPLARQHEMRHWLFVNGLSYTELADSVLVDSVARTITVSRFVPVPGQESSDFPEFLSDAHGELVTVEHVLELAVTPLPWMLTKRGAWTPARSTQPPSLRRPVRAFCEEGSTSRPGTARRHARQASIAL